MNAGYGNILRLMNYRFAKTPQIKNIFPTLFRSKEKTILSPSNAVARKTKSISFLDERNILNQI